MRQQHFFPSFKSDGDLDNIRGEEKGRKIKKEVRSVGESILKARIDTIYQYALFRFSARSEEHTSELQSPS